jgi:hypothetical protein
VTEINAWVILEGQDGAMLTYPYKLGAKPGEVQFGDWKQVPLKARK